MLISDTKYRETYKHKIKCKHKIHTILNFIMKIKIKTVQSFTEFISWFSGNHYFTSSGFLIHSLDDRIYRIWYLSRMEFEERSHKYARRCFYFSHSSAHILARENLYSFTNCSLFCLLDSARISPCRRNCSFSLPFCTIQLDIPFEICLKVTVENFS